MTQAIEFVDLSESATASPYGHVVFQSGEGSPLSSQDELTADLTASGTNKTYVVVEKNVRCFGAPSGPTVVQRTYFALVESFRATTELLDKWTQSLELTGAERVTSRFNLFVSRGRSTDRDARDLSAERTLRLYERFGSSDLSWALPDELADLHDAEARADSLYERIEGLLRAKDDDNAAALKVALADLNDALEQESAALEPVLMQRLPSVESTQRISERADELLAKHGEDPPT